MNEGQVLMEGTPAEIFSDYEKLTAASLDLPEVAQFANLLRKKGFDLPEGVIQYEQLKEILLQKLREGKQQ